MREVIKRVNQEKKPWEIANLLEWFKSLQKNKYNENSIL